MCEPTTIMLAASMMGAATSAVGMYQQGQTQKKLGEYNAQVAENNAKTAESSALDAAARGQIAEDQQRTKTRQMIGTQRAAMAAGGGDLTDQSSANILADTAKFGELDALTVRNNAAREAWGLTNAAADSRAQGASALFQGQQAASAATTNAAGSLLTSSANIYGQGKKAGKWGV